MAITTYTGTHLKSLSGFTEYFYDPTTNLPSHTLLNRWIIVSGGTHLVAATTFPDQYLANFNTGADGTKNVIRCFPISDGSGLASGGTWTTYKGTVTSGLAGENMCASPDQGLPYFSDPDSPVDTDALGSTVTVSGGTGFVGTTTLGVIKLVGSLMKWVDIGDALPPAVSYSGNWTLNHPAYKLSDAQALVPPVTSYTGDLVLGLIGDSLTFNIGTGSLFAGYLATTFPNANSITLDNLGSSGKKTSDWVPGQALYISAVSTANSHGWKVCNICLGVNDVNTGVSASTILANLRLIVDGLFADVATLNEIVVQDIPSPTGSSTVTANTAISAIGHGATYTTAPFYSIFAGNSVLREDTLHPSDDAGRRFQSLTWLIDLSTAIPAAEAPTVPGAPVLDAILGLEVGSTGILVEPTAPASDGGSAIISYKIYRKRIGINAAFVLAGTLPAASLGSHFLDTGTADGDTVDYKVTAVNAIGESAASATRETTSQGPHPAGWISSPSGSGLGISISIGI